MPSRRPGQVDGPKQAPDMLRVELSVISTSESPDIEDGSQCIAREHLNSGGLCARQDC